MCGTTTLVPVLIDLELAGHRLRECFTWSVPDDASGEARPPNEAVHAFAARLVAEEHLPECFADALVTTISAQTANALGQDSSNTEQEDLLETIQCALPDFELLYGQPSYKQFGCSHLIMQNVTGWILCMEATDS